MGDPRRRHRGCRADLLSGERGCSGGVISRVLNVERPVLGSTGRSVRGDCREEIFSTFRPISLGRPGNDLLSRVLRRSTIGAGAFHGRVRNGIGCSHPAIITRSAKGYRTSGLSVPAGALRPSTLSSGHCLMRAIKSIELLVPVSCTHCCASTPGLSTWSSSTALEGELVSRWVSRLDAFSGYPVRT